jgi:hypothetical protein
MEMLLTLSIFCDFLRVFLVAAREPQLRVGRKSPFQPG